MFLIIETEMSNSNKNGKNKWIQLLKNKWTEILY